MQFNSKMIIFLLLVQIAGISTIQVNSAPGGDIENPKPAVVGVNSGNISSNAAGGRFFLNFSIEVDKLYDFQLVGDTNTKFDLFFFVASFLPSIIVEDSAEYVDTNAYPVTIEGYTSDESWVMIQVFSNHIDGGLGDFTLTISEVNLQTSSSSTTVSSTSSTNPVQTTDENDTPAFGIVLAALSLIGVTATFRLNRNKFVSLLIDRRI